MTAFAQNSQNEARYSSFTAQLTGWSVMILDQLLISDNSFSTNIQDAKSETNFDQEIIFFLEES